ncbi:hypothetical protein CPB83DRAFT_366671 [Crepidotus variabilis]|uniref:Uncharacterized protein n=1 Tax=Crepidotus variabilis TaxID=179855 RepID=A0A9P6EFI8_9AGAR|nr:hypothetical protein CPB83DRAFT_366671 [Crepidotus variabilis]
MVDWKSPAVILANGRIVVNMIHVIAGVYLYNFVAHLDFDFDFILGRRKFKWPLIVYFANRYFMLGFYIVMLILHNNPSDRHLNCQLIYDFLHIFGEFSRGLASLSFALRTIAVWSQNRFVIAGLCLMTLGQWGIIANGIRASSASWLEGYGCFPSFDSTWYWTLVLFIYTVVFDFVFLVLNAYKLGIRGGARSKSGFANLIFKQGLIFYMIAFLVDLLAIIFLAMNLNLVMATIMTMPAELIPTLIAGHAFRSLTMFSTPTDMSTQSSLFFAKSHSRRPSNGVSGVSIQGRTQRTKAIEIEMKTSTLTETESQGDSQHFGSKP